MFISIIAIDENMIANNQNAAIAPLDGSDISETIKVPFINVAAM